MLSLIPALLLLAFHGPAAVERLGHAGKLPEALRALERAWTPVEEEADDDGKAARIDRKRQVFASLTALTADPEFSKAVSELYGQEGALAESRPDDPSLQEAPDPFHNSPSELESGAVRAGFADCRRTRDGPIA